MALPSSPAILLASANGCWLVLKLSSRIRMAARMALQISLPISTWAVSRKYVRFCNLLDTDMVFPLQFQSGEVFTA
jgi:hypothetical protein